MAVYNVRVSLYTDLKIEADNEEKAKSFALNGYHNCEYDRLEVMGVEATVDETLREDTPCPYEIGQFVYLSDLQEYAWDENQWTTDFETVAGDRGIIDWFEADNKEQINGVIAEIFDGEVGEIYVTESNAPHLLSSQWYRLK